MDDALAGRSARDWRPNLADDAMLFAGLMSNITGPEAGQKLSLMPWQQLVFAALFGSSRAAWQAPERQI